MKKRLVYHQFKRRFTIKNQPMKTIKFLSFLLLLLISTFTYGQEEHEENSNHEVKSQAFEAVLSGLFMYTPESGSFDPATELHLTYWTTHKWAFGVGYTLIFEEERRVGHELAALLSHKPWQFLTVNIGPSFSLPNSHNETEVSGYLEGEFAFQIGELHAGPTIGVLIGEEFRVFSGLHISYEF